MTDRFDPARVSVSGKPNRTHLAVSLGVALTLLSSCALPFTDEGQDISTQVQVSGAETAPTMLNGNGDDDESLSSTANPQEEQPATSIAPQAAQIDERFNGRSVEYLGIHIELGDLIVTSQTAEQYLRAEEATEGQPTLLVEVAVTNQSNGSVGLPRTVLGIRLASGERVVAEEMLASDGDRVDVARPEAQATERVLLAFADVDLSGASFEVTEASTIPVFIPLDPAIPVAAPYLLDLPAQRAVTDLSSPSLWPSCEYAWTGEVVDARIVLEGVDGRQVERALKGSRWVAIDLLVTNDTTDSEDSYPCNQVAMPVGNVSPRLRIDGVATAETNGVPISQDIEMGEMAVVQFWYRIDRDTETIELTDTNGTRIAAWELDLPLVDGEA